MYLVKFLHLYFSFAV